MRLILTVAVTCWPTTEVLFSGAGKRAKYCDQRDRMSVCLSVCSHISKTTRLNVHAAYGRNLMLLLRQLNYVMYFRFRDDVMFSHNAA